MHGWQANSLAHLCAASNDKGYTRKWNTTRLAGGYLLFSVFVLHEKTSRSQDFWQKIFLRQVKTHNWSCTHTWHRQNSLTVLFSGGESNRLVCEESNPALSCCRFADYHGWSATRSLSTLVDTALLQRMIKLTPCGEKRSELHFCHFEI